MEFTRFGQKSVLAAFDGGEISSDAGVLLLREAADRLNLFSRMAECFVDRRDQDRVRHSLSHLLSQRVTGVALGYEDLNDHDSLRFDPALKLLGKPENNSLAASSTLGRLEKSWETGNRRYHKTVPNLKKLSALLPELFVESHDEITLEIKSGETSTP